MWHRRSLLYDMTLINLNQANLPDRKLWAQQKVYMSIVRGGV